MGQAPQAAQVLHAAIALVGGKRSFEQRAVSMARSGTFVRQEEGRVLSQVPNPAVDASKNTGPRSGGTKGRREASAAVWAMR